MWKYRKKKKQQDPQPGTSIREVKSRHYTTVTKRSMQGLYSGTYRNFRSGLPTYRSKCTRFNYFISVNIVWLVILHVNDWYSQKWCFYNHSIYFRALHTVIPIISLMLILRGLQRNSMTSLWLTIYEVNFTQIFFFCNSSSRNKKPCCKLGLTGFFV
jgi:hypothetical protein